jgi:NAD+ kinase
MKIALHGRPFNNDSILFIKDIMDQLAAQHIELVVYESFLKHLKTKSLLSESLTYKSQEDFQGADYMFSIGGDGTFLDAVTFSAKKNIPILGINVGRLGFLTSVNENNYLGLIKRILDKQYLIEERSLIQVETDSHIFGNLNFGLNEFTITKRDSASMIIVHAYLDGEFLNSYWADGLIISTPTGSTGYSLSCGGPLVLPLSQNFVITPISPHNLNVRPLIVPDTSNLTFEIQGRSKTFLASLDSRSETVKPGTKIAVRKETFSAKIIKLDQDSFTNTLRLKLNWGLDVRNY